MANFRSPRLINFNDPGKRLRLLLYSGAAFLIFVFITALGLPLTSDPGLCGSICHATTREYYSWQKSSHSNVACDACHSRLGQVAYLYEKVIDSPRYAYAEFTQNYKRPINENSRVGREMIPREICERCHNLRKRNVTPSLVFGDNMVGKGFKRYHSKHLKKGMPCTLCHNRIAHKIVNEPKILKLAGYSKRNDLDQKVIGKEYLDGLSMTEGCFRCHSPFKKERNQKLIKKYKSSKAPKACVTCHDKKMLPMGHGENWTKTHPITAKKTGFIFCLKCHGKGKKFQSSDGKRSRCRDCHHRITAKKKLQLDNCKKCHKEMALPKKTIVAEAVKAMRVLKQPVRAAYLRKMVYHKVHFPSKFTCTKCHLSDLETTKMTTFELCKNENCHPPGQKKPLSGAKLCKQCHFSPHDN